MKRMLFRNVVGRVDIFYGLFIIFMLPGICMPQCGLETSLTVADPAMGGPPPPHIDQNLGLVAAAQSSLPQTRVRVFI